MTREDLLKMIDEADECRVGLMGTLRYVSFRLSKALLRERVDDLIAAGVSVKVCKVDSGRTLYFEEKP